ncbi:hypothetical protein H5410_056603 [Solanum commersonii]|uniref:Uncharacterized protein n=1 Tax=Solanum commersonii TaxID=4109 RepID=A0A9J5WM74_SOLCO|nr:hypothetical protein H5410_056603 [Solanum commersonii]
MDLLVIQISDVSFAKKICGRSSRPLLWIRLIPMGKPIHFQGQTILGAGKPTHFQGQTSPGAENRTIFKVKRTPERTIAFEPVCPDGQTGPFSMSNEPRIHGSFGDSNFRRHFCQILSWTSVTTLAMKPIGPDGQTGPFSWSNDARRRSFGNPNFQRLFSDIFCDVRQDLSYGIVYGSFGDPISDSFLMKCFVDVRQNISSVANLSRRANRHIFKVKRAPERIFDVILVEIFCGCPSRPLLLNRLVPSGKPTHFQSQMSPETLAMELVGPDGQIGSFSWSNEPQRGLVPMGKLTIFYVNLALDRSMDLLVIWMYDVIFVIKIFVDVRQDLSYGVSWLDGKNDQFSRSNNPRSGLSYGVGLSRWGNQPIFKIKRSPELVNPHFDDICVL